MPIVRIDIQAGKSPQHKRAVLAGVRAGIASAFGVDDDRIMQRIVETDAADIDNTSVRTSDFTVVNIQMVGGRADAAKEELYRAIESNLAENPGVRGRDLVILVTDPPAECFFLDGEMRRSAPAEEPSS